MRVALSWLAEWIPLPPLEQLQERLTLGGLEIEEVIHTGPDLSQLRVGAVLECRPHPDADRLRVCRVDLGEPETLEIVCGAPNVAAGQKVAVATHGTVLPGGLKIKRSKIRGVRSNGMICSARELDLGEDQNGILVLPDDAPTGAPLSRVLPACETILDLEITPNRGDWVSMLGIAREVRAHFGGELQLPPTEVEAHGPEAALEIEIGIEEPSACSRYVGRIVHGVRVGSSPEWLQQRLRDAGLRSVNNIVDVTNLVMLEFGQPLHAFDLRRLRGGRVTVRAAQEGEKLLTLDGEDRELSAEDLVIADAAGPVALAGVMGGSESEVTEETTSVLLESARFDPSRVRRTARRLGLHSDASYRFERGVDPEGQGRAADRAARLLAELAGGEVCRGAVESLGTPPPFTGEIRLSPGWLNRLLGTRLEVAEIVALLGRVDVEARPSEDTTLLCSPPRYRSDLHLPADLAEEIARIHGLDRIPATLSSGPLVPRSTAPRRNTREEARSSLAAAGLTEIMTFPATPRLDDDALGLSSDDPRRQHVELVNPIQAEDSVLRTHLLPSVLRAVRANRARQVERIGIFEIGRVFVGGAERGETWREHERLQAVVALCDAGSDTLWGEARLVPIFFRAKGIAERLLAELRRRGDFLAGCDEPFLHPGAAGRFRVRGRECVQVGELHPRTAAHFEIDAPCAVAVADLDLLDGLGPEEIRYRQVSRHPQVRRDLALIVDASVPAGEILSLAKKRGGASLQKALVFDRYEGEGVPTGKVSLAVRLIFQRNDRTLTDAEVAESVDRVVRALEERFAARLRHGPAHTDARGEPR